MGYLVLSVALALGFVFAQTPPPEAPARIAPLRLRMALELSEPPAEQVTQETEDASDDEITALAYGRD
jgi:hypothetical protein